MSNSWPRETGSTTTRAGATAFAVFFETLGSEGEPVRRDPPAPPETRRRLDSVAAVVMTLLSQDATFTGGGERDVLAARAWQTSKDMIARAEPAQVEDLMIPPEQALARVAPWSEVERLIALAQEDDPHAEVVEELSAAGWEASYEDGLWEITGSLGNPVPVASRAADRLGGHSRTACSSGPGAGTAGPSWHGQPPTVPLLSPGTRLAHLPSASPGHTGITVQQWRPVRGARPYRHGPAPSGRARGIGQDSDRTGPKHPE